MHACARVAMEDSRTYICDLEMKGGEIIQIPAPPLSRSDSLTKLSDPILAPAVRVNLLCHLQSTRGSRRPSPARVRTLRLKCVFSLPSARLCFHCCCSFGLIRIKPDKSRKIFEIIENKNGYLATFGSCWPL